MSSVVKSQFRSVLSRMWVTPLFTISLLSVLLTISLLTAITGHDTAGIVLMKHSLYLIMAPKYQCSPFVLLFLRSL